MTAHTALETFTETSHRAANEVIGSYSTSFGLATKLLGARHRQHIRNVYALVRVADEIVDGVAKQAGLSLKEQRASLARFREETERAIACGYSADVIIHAFAGTARLSGFGAELTGPFFDAMAMDLESPEDAGPPVVGFGAERHDTYVFGSAEVVGLMCLRVFARDEVLTDADVKALDRGACQLGAAFQDINFLRDLHDDLERGRNYLGDEGEIDGEAKDAWVAKVRAQLDDAERAIPLLPKDARAAVRCAHAIFANLVDRIDDAPVAELYEDRLRVPDPVKAVARNQGGGYHGEGAPLMTTTVVIGAGVGGLATAALLAREGHDVVVLERLDRVGGRAGVIERDGFRFDTGPSWYLMPRVYDHFFRDARHHHCRAC